MPVAALVQSALLHSALLRQAAPLAGPAFVAGLWQGTLLAAAVWLCLRFAPRATAALRFVLWTAVLGTIALLPPIEVASCRHAAAAHSLLHADLRWSLALAALWLTASMLRAASLARHTYRVWKLHRQACSIRQPESVAPLLATSRRTIEICTSTHVDRPGVIGFFAPRILIPAWLYPQLTAPELQQIVLHEVEHLRRRDDWLNLLQKLALVVFPLNPVLIAVERLLCLERELACDDGVLRRTRAPRLYATCLTTLAERGLDHRAFSLALSTLGDPQRRPAGRSELGRRVQRILRRPSAASPLHTRAVAAAATAVLIATATGLARCPQLISFVPASPTVAAAVPPAPVPAQAMRVVYVDAQAMAPRLVRSSLALKRKSHLARVNRRRPAQTTVAQMQQTKLVAAPEAALLLTSFPEQDRPRLLTLDEPLPASTHFAIVRVDGGWLLVQL